MQLTCFHQQTKIRMWSICSCLPIRGIKRKCCYPYHFLEPCGDGGVATKKGYVEILEFTHFVEFFSFNYVGDNHKEKELVRKVTVVVALDLGCGNTKNLENESE